MRRNCLKNRNIYYKVGKEARKVNKEARSQ
jgi:hypothetical protein